MKRITIEPRPHWRDYAEQVGFNFHTFDGEPYWDETAYYQFSLQQIEQDLEKPTEEIHAMAMDLISDIINDEQKLRQLGIPENFWSYIANSWCNRDPHLYARMDFVYDGNSPAKLLELNYDTPTALFETGFFQWVWLEEQIKLGRLPQGSDQFNSLQDKLEHAFHTQPLPKIFYFSSVTDSIEDKGTVAYLMDIAHQAGIDTRYIAMEDIGEIDGQFVDLDGSAITGLFKLYPWEFLINEDFASGIKTSNTVWLEPSWKLLLSNKGILPLLWQKYPNHPNLLPSFFETNSIEPLTPGWVRKPLFSREGANVELITAAGETLSVSGPYNDTQYIRQALQPLPRFGDSYTMIGSWVVGDSAAGICLREDNSLITKDSSRFVPHIILD
jgi:glutathionylspermidine synthase